jgi:spermidine/putrescine transport system permease protein
MTVRAQAVGAGAGTLIARDRAPEAGARSAAVVSKRGVPRWLGRAGSIALNVYAVLGFVYLFAPIFVIVLFSFNQPRGKFNLVWQRFTFDNWAHPFEKHELTQALTKSVQIAVLATIVATILGALIALALARYRFRGGAIVNLLLVLPLTTPEIVLGASLLNLFVKTDTQRGFATILIAHIMFCVSFVALTVKARVRGFDWTLEDAAMDLGAPPWRTFRRVTLPLIIPGILAAGLLSFSLSIDDYIVTTFTAGPTVTFPLQIAGAFQREISPQINVLASMILVVSVTLLAVGTLFGARREGRA